MFRSVNAVMVRPCLGGGSKWRRLLNRFFGCVLRTVLQVVGSESGGIYTTPLHFRNSGAVEVIGLKDGCASYCRFDVTLIPS